MAKGLTLQELQGMGAKPTGGGMTLDQLQAMQPDHLDGFAVADHRDMLSKASDFITKNNLPGAQLGTAVGNSISSLFAAGKALIQGKGLAAADAELKPRPGEPSFKEVVGDTARSIILPASLAVPTPATFSGAAAQLGSLSAAQGAADALASGGSVGDAAKEAVKSGAVGAAAGGAFNLLGNGINLAASKAGPSALSFTSGVPKAAIEQAGKSPSVAKQGLNLSVREVRGQAVAAHQSLVKDLSGEFQQGLGSISQIPAKPLPAPNVIQDQLLSSAKDIAAKYRVGIGAGAKASFAESAVVKGGEQAAVNETLNTIRNWSDFSATGMQDLAERIGALRNFESGAKTQSSAIVGQIYHTIAGEKGLIPTYYPDLAKLRTNFSSNKTVLDEIGNVLSTTADKPTTIQASVTRLDNLFKENRDEYLNAVRQLGERSGIDFLSLLAGGEFQKVLPGFVRGLGGGGAVGIGASVLNPYLLLLAPLFSPRAVGVAVRNAPAAAKTTAAVTRAAAVQAIPPTQRVKASQ